VLGYLVLTVVCGCADHPAIAPWRAGTSAQEHQVSELFLGYVPGIVLARVGTAVLRAVGYQVLDVPGTSALKAACLVKVASGLPPFPVALPRL